MNLTINKKLLKFGLIFFESRIMLNRKWQLKWNYITWTKEVCNGGVACSLLKLAADKPRPLLQNSLTWTTFNAIDYLMLLVHDIVVHIDRCIWYSCHNCQMNLCKLLCQNVEVRFGYKRFRSKFLWCNVLAIFLI